MPGETTTTLQQVLKEYYSGTELISQVNVDTFMLDKLEKSKKHTNVGGRYYDVPIRLALTGGFGPAGENAALPGAGNVTAKSMQVPYTFLYATAQLSGPVQALSKGDKKAFMSALELSMGSLHEEFRLGSNILLWGYGQGQIGQVSAIASGVITLVDDIHPAGWFYENLKVDTFTSSGTAHDSAMVVTDVDLINRKITVTGASTTVANDYLYISGAKGVSPSGVLAGVDDSTYVDVYMNIQRSATGNKKWKSYVTSAVSGQTPAKFGNSTRGPISTDLIQSAMDQQRVRAGQRRAVDQLISSLEVQRVYFDALQGDRRFDGNNATMFDGGWEELAYSNGAKKVAWYADELCPRYTLFGFHFGHAIQTDRNKKVDKIAEEEIFSIFQDKDPDWNKSTGNILKQAYATSGSNVVPVDAVIAFMEWYVNFATGRPNDHFRVDDIATS